MLIEETTIKRLRDCPDALETIVAWIDEEWGAFSGRSLAETTEQFACEFGSDNLPVSVVAVEDGVPVGVATLRERDSFDWDPGRLPWICNVYVRSSARGRGLAKKLCQKLENVAADFGFSEAHLATIMSGETLYHQIGYIEYKSVTRSGQIFHIMQRQVHGRKL